MYFVETSILCRPFSLQKVQIDESYTVVNGIDNLTSELSGLGSDTVSQVTNLKAFLPNSSPSLMYLPGDSWAVVNFNSDLGLNCLFNGFVSFLGYDNYNGVECTVIQGELEIDSYSSKLLSVEAGSVIKSIIYWDSNNGIPVYAKTVATAVTKDNNNVKQVISKSTEIFFSPA